ncbi:MAG: hypothetical protein V1754_09765 [Pseudomonadota bacterium]
MPKKTPLQQVNEVHGGKEKLVDKIVGLIDRGKESKEEFRKRLLGAANTKLLHIHDVMTEMKEKFGDKSKLVEALLALANRTKDVDFRQKLSDHSPSWLLALHRDWEKKVKKEKPIDNPKKSKKGKKSKKRAA